MVQRFCLRCPEQETTRHHRRVFIIIDESSSSMSHYHHHRHHHQVRDVWFDRVIDKRRSGYDERIV